MQRAQAFTRHAEWFLKLDVRKYFDSVSHDRLLAFLECRFKDRRLLDLLNRIITSYRGPLRIGLPIGSLTSQHFANFYLGWLDRFVTESLRVRGYVRYMDDMVLWHASRETLVEVHARREEFAATHLALDFKPGEVRRTGGGVPFLGCRIFPTRGSFQDSFQCVYTGASTIRLLNAARIGRRVCDLRCGIADAGRREKHTLSCNLCGFGQPGVLNRTVPHDLLCIDV